LKKVRTIVAALVLGAMGQDLIHWKVINGINNPIAHKAPYKLAVDANGVPSPMAAVATAPENTPVGGTMSCFQGRVYAPSAVLSSHHEVTVIFAGYHKQKPKNGLGDDRTIGRAACIPPSASSGKQTTNELLGRCAGALKQQSPGQLFPEASTYCAQRPLLLGLTR
jgi:hypothetical protein